MDEIEQIEVNIADIESAKEYMEMATNCLRNIEECEEVLGYIEDDIDTLKGIIEKLQEKIEDVEEQEEYGSDRKERTVEFVKEAI